MQLAQEKGVDPVAMLLDLTAWAYKQFQENKSKETADMVRDYAKECAPYVSPKLAAVEASGPGGGPIPTVTEILLRGVRQDDADD